jgi:hypothetical protein
MPELPCGKMQPRDQKAGTHLVRLRLGLGLGLAGHAPVIGLGFGFGLGLGLDHSLAIPNPTRGTEVARTAVRGARPPER